MSIVKLRSLNSEDIPSLNIIRNDKLSLSMMNAKYTKHEELFGTKEWAKRQSAGGSFFIIDHNEDCAGFIKSRPFNFGDRGHEFEEIGIAICPDFRGKGLAPGAVSDFITASKNKRFIVRVINDNESSRKMFLKCGFKVIGTISGVIEPDPNSSSLDLIFMEYLK
jgi:RimJ/RimL family protein N-acetyltransferase